MVTNPKLKTKLLYTKQIYGDTIRQIYGGGDGEPWIAGDGDADGGMLGNSKLRIEMVLGGSNTNPSNGNFQGVACVLGKAQPFSWVNAYAIGFNGIFMQAVQADENGNWSADFNEQGPGRRAFSCGGTQIAGRRALAGRAAGPCCFRHAPPLQPSRPRHAFRPPRPAIIEFSFENQGFLLGVLLGMSFA